MTTSPRVVSVIIGTRNRPDTLRLALASIRALEGPDLTFEILVGDNGTDPATPGVVAEFGGHYGRTSVYGCPAARNVAMRKITGEFIAFLDDDDVWLPGHIRQHIALLDAQPDYEAVFGQVQVTDHELRPEGDPWPVDAPEDGDFFSRMMSGYFPQVGATVVRGRAYAKYGLMDETLIGDSDWDWQLRIARDHKIGFVAVPCVLFRQRPRGTFDNLQLIRTSYTRRIFFRHALPNLKRFGSPVRVMRSYFRAVATYANYFLGKAADRAANGDHLGAAKAVLSAAWISPPKVLRAVLSPSRVRQALSAKRAAL